MNIYGKNHPIVALRYNDLGLAWKMLGDSRKVIDCLQRSYRIFRDFYRDNHPHAKSVEEVLDYLYGK